MFVREPSLSLKLPRYLVLSLGKKLLFWAPLPRSNRNKVSLAIMRRGQITGRTISTYRLRDAVVLVGLTSVGSGLA